MRHAYLPLTVLSFALMVVIVATTAAIVSNRARLCLHAAVANAAPAGFDWEAWQSSGVYRFADWEGAFNAGKATFDACAAQTDLGAWVMQFHLDFSNTDEYHPTPADRVWGVASGPVPPPWIRACTTLDFHFPLLSPGRTCAIISVSPGVLGW